MNYHRLAKVSFTVAFDAHRPFGALDLMFDDLVKMNDSNREFFAIIDMDEVELVVTEENK